MSKWSRLTLREAGVHLLDCDHRTPPRSDEGIPYIAIPQIKAGRLDLSDVRLISEENFISWTRRAKPQPWDVILSRRCNPGETAFVPPGLECALGQNLVLLRADGTRVVPEFLRWLVRSPSWWEQVQAFINVGAVFDSLKCADIPNFHLTIPPLPDQRAVSHILGGLDEKIDLNRRMSKSLEAIARAIFKSWFVDFDPVRAKVAGQNANLPKPIADAFPGKFQNSSLGDIPKGWATLSFAETVEILGGGTPKTSKSEYWGGDIPWFSVRDTPKSGDVFVIDTEKTITQEGLKKSATQILPKGTTIISARGTVGNLALLGAPMAMNQSCYGLRGSHGYGDCYTYFATVDLIDDLKQRSHGSVFDTITRDTFKTIRVVAPPIEIASKFEEVARPLLECILSNLRQSRALGSIRDALLPRLISGEIRALPAGSREVLA